MLNTSSPINQNPVKLHLGCGRKIKEGYLNIDQHVSAPGVLQMNIFDLPFPEGSVDEIFTEHMLEHLSKFEVPVALQEWSRVLKPDGKLVMNLPNLEWCLQQWLAKPESDRWGWQLDTIFGLQTHPGEFHKTGFTKPRLMFLLRDAGFTQISIEDYWSHEQGCFWVEASKNLVSAGGSEPSSHLPVTHPETATQPFKQSFKHPINKTLYPPIAPITEATDRPFWSVMIPVFNPQYDYLKQALESLLVQAPEEPEMQIEVVDDCSTEGDVEAWVKAIGQGRIRYTRQLKNLGLLENWNDCIKRAKGEWVHLLHQDDVVLAGFYDRLAASLKQYQGLGAAFCRYFYLDKFGKQYALAELEQNAAGILENWLERISVRQRIQFASIVVKRSTYESVGGFDAKSGSAADWEMWRRIAACYPVWYEPEALACFRIHPLSESSRLTHLGQNIDDTRRSIELAKAYLPPDKAQTISQQALEHYAHAALQHAEQMLKVQDTEAAIALIQQGLLCSHSAEVQTHLNQLLLTNFRYAPTRFNQPLRVIIDGIFFQIVQTGIARVWRSLLEEWAVSGFAQHLILLDRDGTAPKIPGIRYLTIPRYESSRAAADRQLLQKICDREQASLFISTYYTTPLHTPAVFMAYDMIPEVQQADLSLPMWQEKHHSIRYADRYLAISENTAHDLVKFFPAISADRVTVAHCGVDPAFQPADQEDIAAFQAKYGITQPYFLLVGMRNQYKNSRLFFQAFAQLANKAKVSLVCVGPTPFLEEEYQPYVAGSQVHILSLNDAELRFAYAGALAFVYPSRYEGFGLPLLEAMACGCPVITCNNSSIPEVAGDAVLYVSEDDPAELAAAMLQIQQPDLRDRLIQAGFDRISLFSWERMAAIVSQTLSETANLGIQASEGLPRLWVAVPRLLEQYHANPANGEVVAQLRSARQQWLKAWMKTAPAELAEADASELGQIRRSFLQSSFCQVQLTAAEAQDLQALTELLTETLDHPQAVQALLAMLLYRPAYQLALPHHLLAIPANWREEYLSHLLRLPPYFQERGEADAYCHFLKGLTHSLHAGITQSPDDPDWQRIAQIFTDRSNFLLPYFAQQNLQDLYQQRAEILEFSLQQQGYELDYTFPTRMVTPAKLRVGILSSHFSPQTETFATLPVFAQLNRDRFETILFTLQPTGHRLERYSLGHADHFVVLPETLGEQVKLIRDADLDILLIASNLTVAAREITLLALHRLARVQLTGMNSPVTTGMRHMDYYLTSGLTEPDQDVQAHYCETLIPLEGAAQCFDFATEAEPPLTAALTRSDLRLTETAIVYSSGANFYKITPEMIEVWAQIIAQVPDSVLLLYPFNQNWSSSYPVHSFHDRLKTAFARYGMGQERYRILPAAPTRSDVKERLKLTDVYLDSYPFSGMTSLIDPLELGIPTIVMEVDSACSLARGGAFLRELQVADLITFDEAAYVQKAIELGKDLTVRQQIRDRIQQAMDRGPSFLNPRHYGKQMGSLLAQLAQRHQTQALQQAFRLRETNLLAFPDWNQPEEELFENLVSLLRFALTHPDRQTISILVSIGTWDEADANDAISSVLLYLLTEEGIDAEEGTEIVLLQPQEISASLLTQIQQRILLSSEDTRAVLTAKAEYLPLLDLPLLDLPLQN